MRRGKMFVSLITMYKAHTLKKKIFIQSYFENFCDNFITYIHIMFLLSFDYFDFCVNTFFLCKIMFVPKVVNKTVVQITQFSL